jgi:threonine dehydratase
VAGSLVSPTDIALAAERIAPHVVRTPTVPSPGLSALLGVPVTAKLELLQRTGSFKARGATAKLLALTEDERAAGVVAVSGGNHGIALAVMAGALGVAATVVMPESAPAGSVRIARDAGADVRLTPDMAGAFALTAELQAGGLTLVHPFDDPTVIAGQGTVGLELAADAGDLTDVRIWGVETEGAQAMSAALAAGGPVPVELTSIVTTLSAPSVSPLTYEHVSALVTDVLVVPDAEAVQGTLDLADHAKVWAEPAAGCLVPAARRVLEKIGDHARLGLVVCGGNASTGDVTAWAARFGLI